MFPREELNLWPLGPACWDVASGHTRSLCSRYRIIALRGHNRPVVTGRDYPDLKPGEEGSDLAEVTQLRRSGQDSAPGHLSPEPPLLLSRARVSTLRPGGPDLQLVAGPFSGCSELSVTEPARLEAPPRLLSPRAAHSSLPFACPWRVAPTPSVKIGPFFKA